MVAKHLIINTLLFLAIIPSKAQWYIQSSGTPNILYDVSFINESEGWAVGRGGTLLRTSNGGSQWIKETSNTNKWIRAISPIEKTHVWFATDVAYPYNGEIFFYNGNSWASQYFPNIGEPGQFMSICMISENEGWACGNGIFHYNGNEWSYYSGGNDKLLRDVFFIAKNKGWFVGSSGTILQYNGSGWSSESLTDYGRYVHLNSVSFVDENNGWAVGTGGRIYYYNGNSWIEQKSPVTTDLTGVFFITKSNGYAVGKNGYILHFDGNSWTKMNSPTTRDLNAVFFPSTQHGWAVGNDGVIVKYECKTPTQPSNITGESEPCLGSNQTYSVSGITGVFYRWELPAGWEGTSDSNIITVITGTNGGTITVTPINSCGEGPSISKAVNVITVPDQPGSILGDSTPCEDSNVIYSVQNENGVTYNWQLPTGYSGNSTASSINVFVSRNDGVISVKPSNQCGIGVTRNLEIVVEKKPISTGTINGDEIICKGKLNVPYHIDEISYASNYIWEINPNTAGIIKGTKNEIKIDFSSNYTGNAIISVRGENSCGYSQTKSKNIIIDPCLNTEDVDKQNIIEIYPNPAQKVLNFKVNSENEIIIAIYNMAGEILINEKFYKQFEIEVDRFYPGTYMSVIKIKDKIYNYNFLVIK